MAQTDEAHFVHPQIVQWIEQLMEVGVTTITDVQAVLKHYVQTTMLAELKLGSKLSMTNLRTP